VIGFCIYSYVFIHRREKYLEHKLQKDTKHTFYVQYIFCVSLMISR
jgi:hypothetical protein